MTQKTGAVTIEASCPNGHRQTVVLSGATREWAELYCGILDGTSPAYQISPRSDPLSSIGKCCTCLANFDAKVTGFEPAPERGEDAEGAIKERFAEKLAEAYGEQEKARKAGLLTADARGVKSPPDDPPGKLAAEREGLARGIHVCAVRSCARCGGDHESVTFTPLANAPDEWDWWGTCPNLQQPIYMKFVPDDPPAASKGGPAIPRPEGPAEPWTSTERHCGGREVTTTDGRPPAEGLLHGLAPQPVNPATGMHGAYYVLSERERAKGFVRPVRRAYKHEKCGGKTTMGLALAETYARDPKFYGSTYCAHCQGHFPVGEAGEFVWADDGSKVGT